MKDIPIGPYCYFKHRGDKCSYFRWREGEAQDLCPIEVTEMGVYGWCDWLGEGDDPCINDQCKICGINDDWE